jgi:GTP-binding protein HflX
LGGSGETQLELEKRKIAVREALLKDELKKFEEKRMVEREARRNNALTTPTIGLVGYTNAGKTALMNILSHKEFESENRLFQTLNTAIKR